MAFLQKKLSSIGNALQKINLAKLIDDLERHQELADHLEHINTELGEEADRKKQCREAHAACLQTILDHLAEFLEARPDAVYEDWISELHPDNLDMAKANIDHRFYVKESDHRMIWNSSMESLMEEGQDNTSFENRLVHYKCKQAPI
jgi:hypothetical protein